MRRLTILIASSGLLLAACQADVTEGLANSSDGDTAAAVEMIAPEAMEEGRAGGAALQVPDAQVPQLAYAYAYTIETPTAEVAALAARHEQACLQAGPQRCQVIGSSTQAYGEDQRMATLEIRAEPAWLAAFRNGLAEDAEAADGRIADTSTTSEDLTRALIDTEAHLRAKTALRDRLQTMLATRDGNLQTVLEVERELARVQGEIDAATSTLEVMRARVAMSRLTMTYQSRGVLAPDDATAPLSNALNNALSLFMMGLAAIVTVLAFALPFALVIIPVVWLVLRARTRRRAERSARRAAETTEPAAD
jgi:hypothetical protein